MLELEKMIENQTIPNALLFTGLDKASIKESTSSFSKRLAGPADIHEYHPEGKIGMHSIEALRKFSEEVYLVPFNGARKVFIIHDADRMLPTSSNALLKTLEEPAKSSIIILISHEPSRLLPTILSRCICIRFEGKNRKQADHPVLKVLAKGGFKTYQELKEAAGALGASYDALQDAKRAEYTSDDEKQIDGHMAIHSSDSALELFNAILSWYRDAHLLKVGGDPIYLMNPEDRADLEKVNIQPLEKIEKMLTDAKLSLDRFTPLSMVLERLFLELF